MYAMYVKTFATVTPSAIQLCFFTPSTPNFGYPVLSFFHAADVLFPLRNPVSGRPYACLLARLPSCLRPYYLQTFLEVAVPDVPRFAALM
jgi:hypothetical protein